MEINKFLKECGYTREFSLAVKEELDKIPDSIPKTEQNKRRLLFDKTIITIDGEDAKDLDDAISLEILDNGNRLLGVHIADVSHYVKEGSELDREAYNRGTSVYLVDTVIPMLPPKLSNGVCSLLPQQPRLTISCFMEILPNGGIINYSIEKTMIKITERMDYTTVAKILDGDMAMRLKYEELIPMLEQMRTLALIMRDKRMRRGSIDFNFPEAKVITDENGRVTDIIKYDIKISNKIIEEFMLAANETVAKHLLSKDLPALYRVHEPPETEKIHRLASVVRLLGHRFREKDTISPKAMQNLLFDITGTDEEPAVSAIMLRSMMKARYSEENLGHFGLAAEHYCHFTSPIRRYPDLFVHRMLTAEAKGKLTKTMLKRETTNAKKAAVQSSETEALAAIAERDYVDYKACEYMSDKVGQRFEVIISSITSFGFFVQLDNTVEGLVRMVDLDDDYYEFDEENLVLTGRRTGRIYKIGDKISVILAKVNTELKQIDFVLFNERPTKKKKTEQQKKGGGKKNGTGIRKKSKGGRKAHRAK